MGLHWNALLAIVFVLSSSQVFCATDEYYTAAAVELVPLYDCDVKDQVLANDYIQTNLERIVRISNIAAEKGADVLVLPEHSIVPDCDHSDLPRDIIHMYLEDIPDPEDGNVVPCDEPETFKDRPQLHTLSCVAKNNSMYLQVNMGDVKPCSFKPEDPYCNKDGRLQLNTNVVFDRSGAIVLRYHKEHVFNEPALDAALKMQSPLVHTDFGTFASYVCFDLVLERIVEVVNQPDVDGVFFSTMWENGAPLFMTTQFFLSWAVGNNKTLVAADLQIPGRKAVGSGIFHGRDGALVYTFDPDGITKLLMSRVPRRGHRLDNYAASITAITKDKTFEWDHDGVAVSFEGGDPGYHPKDLLHVNRYHEVDMTNFTLVKLINPSDTLEVCHREFCCKLEYSMDRVEETFYLAAYNGTQGPYSPVQWCEEDCMVVRCEDVKHRKCAAFPMRSFSVFRYLSLKADFSTQYVYPSVVSDALRLVPMDEWKYDVVPQKDGGFKSGIVFDSPSGQDLLEVGLKGRCFSRDSELSFF